MPLRTVLRCSPAIWAGIVLIPFLFLLAGSDVVDDRLWEAAGASATVQLVFVTTVCGGCAAWEGSRVSRGRVLNWAPVRGNFRVAWERIVPVLCLGLLAQVAVLARFTRSAWESPGHLNPGLVAMWIAALLAHTVLGYVVGYRLPQLIGVPVVLVGSFFWGSWPAALESPSWIRHLNGQGTLNCCTIDRELSVRSVAATLTLYTSFVLVAVLLISLRHHIHRWVGTAVALAVGVTVSVTLAVPLKFDGTQARDGALVDCAGSRPEICLWPEQEPERAQLTGVSRQVHHRLEKVGVQLPPRLTFDDVRSGRLSALEQAATTGLPEDAVSCSEANGEQEQRDSAPMALHVWASLTAGTGPQTFSGRMPGDAVALAQKVRDLPLSAQRRWYERNNHALRYCDVKPQLGPDAYVSGPGATAANGESKGVAGS